MNTKNLKAYAPKARRQFMEAVAKRAAHFGIYEDEIAPVSFQGSTAIIEGNAFTKQQGEQRKRLEKRVKEKGYGLFVREMAYTWFNRLAALRYMELHDFFEHGFRVISNPSNQDGLPEILDHSADVADMLGLDKAQIIEWQLAGDKQEVLYRELLLGQCHHLHSVMPFLFEAIDDATELLLPDNLTKTDSILKGLVNDIPEEDWQQIEVIGWLYQFYISEHKDAVIGKVVKSEDIPAATQLFTPNWIVKYLVQNSIGRQWLATYPDSSIKAKMEYYIEPAEQTSEVNAQLAAITPSSIDPESIKALDPACGSGHILVEMYELLREIYLERGYRLREIPELILTKNIYGLDIDDRAAQLAGFALLMKAREDDRRIFQRVQDGSVKLNVYALQSTEGWDSASLWHALNLDGKAKQGSSGDLFVETKKFDVPTGEYAEYFDLLKYLIVSFEQAKTLGSLIQIDKQYLPALKKFKAQLLNKLKGTDPATVSVAKQLLPMIEQTIVLAQRYDAVNLNPPYLGPKGMNAKLKEAASSQFKESKSDLFACFIQRSTNFLAPNGLLCMITMQSWMFLSSFKNLRMALLQNTDLVNLLHTGPGIFPELGDYNVLTSAFTIKYQNLADYISRFVKANESPNWDYKVEALSKNTNFFDKKLSTLNKVPDFPFVYWLSETAIEKFHTFELIGKRSPSRVGLQTGSNELFVRSWHEIDVHEIGFGLGSTREALKSGKRYFPYNKGGNYRKWYGNNEFVVNWENDGEMIKNNLDHSGKARSRPQNTEFYFKEGIVYSLFGFENFGVRYKQPGFIFDVSGSSLFPRDNSDIMLAFLCSNVAFYFLKALAPTVNFQAGDINRLPSPPENFPQKIRVRRLVDNNIELCKSDWDSNETSWDFTSIFHNSKENMSAESFVSSLIQNTEKKLNALRANEEEINRIFIELYSVENDVMEHVNERDLTIKEVSIEDSVFKLLSYSIGCAMGRYSLDRQGLVYAYSGNRGFKELVEEGAYKTFPADDDGIIPLASKEWFFEDDATARFREFVKTVWGTEHIQDNLAFAAESLCLNAIKPKKGESAMETIRRYFSTQFFSDHCKMYKKRPIYWLFSSGKEKAFECLVYLHRYNEATLSRMRTEYVTPLMGKYEHQLARKMEEVVEATGTEQRRIEKEIKELEKKQAELRKFDEELQHYAEMRISLDLDDGVKANYGKFGNLLANVKAIHGKAVK